MTVLEQTNPTNQNVANEIIEYLELVGCGYRNTQIMEMMGLTKKHGPKGERRALSSLKKRAEKFILSMGDLKHVNGKRDESIPYSSSELSEGEGRALLADRYAPDNPLMWDRNLGTNQMKVIDELIGKKILPKLQRHLIKKFMRPIGDDDFTRGCLQDLARWCRDNDLPWHVSTSLAMTLRRRIKKSLNNELKGSLVSSIIDEYDVRALRKKAPMATVRG